jgi:excisionase family DNA binding protein
VEASAMAEPYYYTLAEAAERLHVHPRTLQRRISETGLAFARAGRTPIFSEADLALLVEALKCRAPPSRQAKGKTTGSAWLAGRAAGDQLRSLRRQQTAAVLRSMRADTKPSSAPPSNVRPRH